MDRHCHLANEASTVARSGFWPKWFYTKNFRKETAHTCPHLATCHLNGVAPSGSVLTVSYKVAGGEFAAKGRERNVEGGSAQATLAIFVTDPSVKYGGGPLVPAWSRVAQGRKGLSRLTRS